jgi:hypothetical protein
VQTISQVQIVEIGEFALVAAVKVEAGGRISESWGDNAAANCERGQFGLFRAGVVFAVGLLAFRTGGG